MRDGRFWISAPFVVGLLVVAILAPLVAPHSPDAMSAAKRFQGSSREFPLGTDEFGRDILSRLIYGARLSLLVSVASVAIAATLGTVMGTVAGFRGGVTDLGIMRVVDAILSFPAIVLAIFVVVFIGPELQNLILTIGILYLPRFARIVHGVTLLAKHYDYVDAARAMGASDRRILVHAILPNLKAPAMVQISLALGDAILLESSLSFLGLGPPPPAPAWGRIIAQSSRFMHLGAHSMIWPSVVISVTVLAFNVLGDAIRDALDPRLRGVES